MCFLVLKTYFPIELSGKTVDYIYPKCKYKFKAPIKAVLEFK